VRLIDHANVQPKQPNLPRVSFPVAQLSLLGKECLGRATLEAERRYCGNTGETLTGEAVVLSDYDLAAALLDPRTKPTFAMGDMYPSGSLRRATALLIDEYVKFATKAEEFLEELRALKRQRGAAGKRPRTAEDDDADDEMMGGPSAPAAEDEEEHTEVSDLNSDPNPPTPEHVRAERCKAQAQARRLADAKRCVKNWVKHFKPNWQALFPKAGLPEQDLNEMHLMDLDVGPLFHEWSGDEDMKSKYGYLLLMMHCSPLQIGALAAESFCERMISIANMVCTKLNIKLSDEDVEMLVVLKMNKAFIEHCRQVFGALSAKQIEEYGEAGLKDAAQLVSADKLEEAILQVEENQPVLKKAPVNDDLVLDEYGCVVDTPSTITDSS